MTEGEDGEDEPPKRLPSFRPPSSGMTDVVGKLPKTLPPRADDGAPLARAGRRRPRPLVQDEERLIGSDPPDADGLDVEIDIPAGPGIPEEESNAPAELTGLDAPDAPIEEPDDDLAARIGRPLPGTRDLTEKVARALTPPEPEEEEDVGAGGGAWLVAATLVGAAAVVVGVFLSVDDTPEPESVTTIDPAPEPPESRTTRDELEEPTADDPGRGDPEPLADSDPLAESDPDSDSDSDPDPNPDPDSESESAPEDLAALPSPRPAVSRENPWVRRNRAADIRQTARRHYMNGRYAVAHREFLHSLEWDPENVDAMRYVSRALQRLGELDAALSWANRAVRTEPANARNHELLGDQLLMMERRDDAIAAYQTGLEHRPRDRRLRSRLRRLD